MSNLRRTAAFLALFATALASGCIAREPRGAGPPLLMAAPGSPTPISARAMAAGDLNGDRCDDLVVCTASAIQVFLGSGDRPWQPDPDITLELPAKTSEMALADLNQDGRLDIVLADHDSYAVAVMLGSGDGRFQSSAGSPFVARVGDHPHTHGLAVADINRDGQADIVTANNNEGDVSVLLGDGQGGFVRAPGSPFACGPRPYPIAAADINGDGYADVLVPNATQDEPAKTLTILRGNADGQLAAAAGSPLTCDETLWYVAAGDLNADQRTDVIATHIEGGTGLTILLNRGDGQFSPARESPLELGHGAWGVEIADMNRDGHADLVVAADTSLQLFLGDGLGSFRPAGGSPYPTGKGAWRLAVADFNGDGKLDVAIRCVEANHLEVLLGN